MKIQFEQVTEFHRKIGETVTESPSLLQHNADLDTNLARSLRQILESFNRAENPKSQLTRRALMAVEELAEWIEAHAESDLVAARFAAKRRASPKSDARKNQWNQKSDFGGTTAN